MGASGQKLYFKKAQKEQNDRNETAKPPNQRKSNMTTHRTHDCKFAAAAALLAALVLAAPARAQVVTSNPGLPVTYPDGVYRTPDQVHADFHGPGLAIVLTNIEHRPFAPAQVHTNGPNEQEDFNSEMVG